MKTPHVWPIRVYWEDTDASGVVYHANYLRWFERGRSEWLRGIGGTQQAWLDGEGMTFTVSELTVRYRRPARLDDLLEVHTSVREVRRASLWFHQQLIRLSDGERLCEANVRAACVDRLRFRPRALPETLFSVTIAGDVSPP